MSHRAEGGLAAHLLALADELRAEGLAIGTAELLDAFAALGAIDWRSERDFRNALCATLAKSPEDRRVFELVFDRFMARTTALQALHATSTGEAPDAEDESSAGAEPGSGPDGEPQRWPELGAELSDADVDALRRRIAASLMEAARGGAGAEATMRDLARLAIAAFSGPRQGSGVIGVDVQRIRRALDLRAEGRPELPEDDPRHRGVPRDALRRFEALLRRELEAAQIERTGTLPPARALRDLQRALPSSPLRDLAAVQRVVAQLRRRLATQGREARGHARHAHVDVRRTMRASLQTGGVPVVLKYRPRRPRRPEIFVLCDVSTSVTSASVFFLSVLHALHDSFRKIRSFVFIERVSEVTETFERERDFRALSEQIARGAGVADISGYTDYGRVWSELLGLIRDELHPRATLIVLGDARTNGRDPGVTDFAGIAARAGRTFWLNPEPRLYWNYGDSVMAAYEPYCHTFECWTTTQLEEFVRALASPELALTSRP
ncbi:MAG: VWA domain-containing protein [Acidobacteriota bacterium]|nr:VWA domain-containing protein [Acidobacteriota bacterium]